MPVLLEILGAAVVLAVLIYGAHQISKNVNVKKD